MPAATVAAVEDDVAHDEVLGWYAGAMAELDAVVATPDGAPGGLYDNELFELGHGHVLVLPADRRAAPRGRVHPVTLPAVELAVTTHHGEHDDIDVTYGGSARGWWPTRSPWPAPCGRPTSSARGTPPTPPPGAPRSAGRSSRVAGGRDG